MISRNEAAHIRYEVLVRGRNRGEVAREFDVTVSAVSRIVEGMLVPVAEDRVVVRPNYSPRSRVITAEDRVVIAHMICYGATLQSLADRYGVTVRAIQHVKEGFTARVGQQTKNSRKARAQGDLCPNVVAEARYRHHVQEEPITMIAAGLMAPYKNLYRAITGKTFRTSHGRVLRDDAVVDKESLPGKALMLWLYGADIGFISDTTDVVREAVVALVDNLTVKASE